MEGQDLRGENQIIKKDKKKLCFKDYKNNTLHSLNEVEYFLNNLDKAFKCVSLYKFFRY